MEPSCLLWDPKLTDFIPSVNPTTAITFRSILRVYDLDHSFNISSLDPTSVKTFKVNIPDSELVLVRNDFDSWGSGIFVTEDGRKMFIMEGLRKIIHEYDLNTPFDVATAVFVSNIPPDYPVGNTYSSATDLTFSPDGLQMFVSNRVNVFGHRNIIDAGAQNSLSTYDLPAPFDLNATHNTAAIGSSINITISNEGIGAGFGLDESAANTINGNVVELDTSTLRDSYIFTVPVNSGDNDVLPTSPIPADIRLIPDTGSGTPVTLSEIDTQGTLGIDANRPEFTAAITGDNTIDLRFNEAVMTDETNGASWSITGGAGSVFIDNSTISENTRIITLGTRGSDLDVDNPPTIHYSNVTGSPVHDVNDNAMANATSSLAVNGIPPVFSSAIVTSPGSIDITLSEPVTLHNVTLTDFELANVSSFMGSNVSISAVSASGDIITLNITGGAINFPNNDIQVRYTQKTGIFNDTDNNLLQNFDFEDVTNPRSFPPLLFVSAVSPTSGQTAKVGDPIIVTISEVYSRNDLLGVDNPVINGRPATFENIGGGNYTFNSTINEGDDSVVNENPLLVNLNLMDSQNQIGNAITTISHELAPRVDAVSPSISFVNTTVSSGAKVAKVGDHVIVTVRAANDESGLVPIPGVVPTIHGINAIVDDLDNGHYTFNITIPEGGVDVFDNSSLTVALNLQDTAGNNGTSPITTIDQADAPGIDANSPRIVHAFAESAEKINVVITENIQHDDLAPIGFILTSNTSNAVSVSGVAVSGADADIIVLTLNRTLIQAEVITLSYTQENRTILDLNNNVLRGRSGVIVAPADLTGPVLTLTSISPTSGNTARIGQHVNITVLAQGNDVGLLAVDTGVRINGKPALITDHGDSSYTFSIVVKEGDTDVSDNAHIDVALNLKDLQENVGSTPISMINASFAPGIDGNSPDISFVNATVSGGGGDGSIATAGSFVIVTVRAANDETGLGLCFTQCLDLGSPGAFVIGGEIASFSAVGNGFYTFNRPVTEGQDDISDDAPLLVSIFLQDAAGNPSLTFITSIKADDAPGIDANTPLYSPVAISPTDGTTLGVGGIISLVIQSADPNDNALLFAYTPTINGVNVSSTTSTSTGAYNITSAPIAEGDPAVNDTRDDLPVNITLRDVAGNIGRTITSVASGGAPGIDADSPTISFSSMSPNGNAMFESGQVILRNRAGSFILNISGDKDLTVLGNASILGSVMNRPTVGPSGHIETRIYGFSHAFLDSDGDLYSSNDSPLPVNITFQDSSRKSQ